MPSKKTKNDHKSFSQKQRSLILIVTKNCNLKCSYCYEKHENRNNEIMELQIAKKALTGYLNAKDDFHSVGIEFFGGEPFLAFPLIKDIVEWVIENEWSHIFDFLISSNGTILTEEIKDWLIKHKDIVTVAFSIDGTRTAHNLTRSNSYDSVRNNMPFFIENWPDQAAKMTISAETIPFAAEGVIELEEMGIQFTANVAFENFWGNEQEKEELLKTYEKQLSRLVDYYADHPGLFPVSPLLDAVPEYLELPGVNESTKDNIVRYCGAGHEMVVIDVDGNEYPCHRFVPWITGKPAPQHLINRQPTWQPNKCAECKLILSCPTCAGFNWEINGDTGNRTTFHCEAYKLEVLASTKLEALRLGKYTPAELAKLPLKEAQQIKRSLHAVLELTENGLYFDNRTE
ncbi:MAG: radical SAM protein [Candidatus Aminicenantes bacterium]|nr:radical SAM protein [Candidatus Aminicenantes bacterium]